MSADFWAGYISGAVGIVIGNPLDLIKTRIQAGPSHLDSTSNTQQITPTHWSRQFERWSALVRGAAAPILGYGALNALLFMTYNRSLALLNTGDCLKNASTAPRSFVSYTFPGAALNISRSSNASTPPAKRPRMRTTLPVQAFLTPYRRDEPDRTEIVTA